MTVNPVVHPSKERHPKVFLSYTWDSEAHKQWVLDLAAALRAQGVDVTLDEWHLQPGQDKNRFMEESIVDSDHVLIICTPAYAAKANERDGGAGYETSILSAGLIENLDTTKFIPILREGEWGLSGAIPRYLASRRGFDLRGDPYSDDAFERLVRTLHGRPSVVPPLGKIPSFGEQDLQLQPEFPEVNAPAMDPAVPHARLLEGMGLDVKELELIWHASHDPSGQISHIKAIGRDCLQVNQQTFPEQRDPRSHAEWFGALRNLVLHGLLEGVGYEAHFYRLTPKGWEVSDALGDFAIWRASEITIECRYMIDRPADTVVVTCKRIIRLPAEFYRDGFSVKQPKRLVVEGIQSKDPRFAEGFPFEPSHAWFRDPANGQEIWFHLYSEVAITARALRLQING